LALNIDDFENHDKSFVGGVDDMPHGGQNNLRFNRMPSLHDTVSVNTMTRNIQKGLRYKLNLDKSDTDSLL
jgi:hypothetical protein